MAFYLEERVLVSLTNSITLVYPAMIFMDRKIKE